MGATLDGARVAVRSGRPVLSTLGGFHHAAPDKASGLCPVNDVAVAVAALRNDGFDKQICILDLDAHPPDGTAACVHDDPMTWVGSLSGSDWGPIPGADETVLPVGSGDAVYLVALGELLSRMPKPALTFVLAGGDVLAGDRFGQLGMSLKGVRSRDQAVLKALGGTGSVWMPAGGYSRDSWRVLAGTGLVLIGRAHIEIPTSVQPENLRYDSIARRLDPAKLGNSDDWFAPGELERELGMKVAQEPTLLGTYTREGVRYALDAYGIFAQLERLGYDALKVEMDRVDVGERLRITGEDDRGERHLLGEVVVEERTLEGHKMLFVHWLTLRHPAATFGVARRKLPGQEVPGLGLSLEAIELLERAARRIGAKGVAFEPSYYHTAWASSETVRFLDDARQGRFEALVRDLGTVKRHDLSQALADGRVLLNGEPYEWEPAEMVFWLDGRPDEEPDVDAERERCRFVLAP
ncbi:MAG: histone deacetylase [Myxococcota bacterium]